jgi:ferric iron reductase protein FhuF
VENPPPPLKERPLMKTCLMMKEIPVKTKMYDGIPYEPWFDNEENNPLYRPVEYSKHPLVCKCGCQQFEVFFPEPYYTNVRCTSCGMEETVHSG